MDLGKLNILIIEDDNDLATRLAKDLSAYHFKTKIAKNYNEAKTLIFSGNIEFNAYLIDVKLPDGNGFSLVESIKRKNEDAIIIIMSGYLNNKILEKSHKSEYFEVVQKPFSIKHDIIPIIKKCLKTIHLRKENLHLNSQILHISKLAALGELSATVIHDIRGPITMIQLTCEDIKDDIKSLDEKESENVQYHLSQINKACAKISKLVDHLRNYSRKDALEEEEEYKNIEEIIENSLFLVKQKIRSLVVKVELQIEDKYKTAQLLCYPNKFEQVLMNLMSNACDAMKKTDKKELKIRAYVESQSFNISISDTGEGIPDEILAKIFDSFFTTKPKGEGTGLGLSIVKNIVKEHSGDLVLASVVGQGTTFTVKLPLSKIKLKSSENGATNPTQAA